MLWEKLNFAMISNTYKLLVYDWFGTKRRSSRKEFNCRFVMMWFLSSIGIIFMDKTISYISLLSKLDVSFSFYLQTIVFLVFALIVTISFCSITQLFFLIHRRIHDLGFRGWWQLLIFSPISPFFILVLMVIKGEEGKNKYGDPPKF